jgi:hypothetical protein
MFAGMKERHEDTVSGAAYLSILAILAERNLQGRHVYFLSRARLVLVSCALCLAGLAVLLVLGGFDARLGKYLFSVAVVVLGLPALLSALIEGAILLAREPRPSSFWARQARALVMDGLRVERLCAHAPSDLKLVHSLVSLRHNAFRDRQRFVLGSAAAISPFIVMLLLVAVPIGIATDLLVHYLPWAKSLASNAHLWLGILALGWTFAFVRLHANGVDEHFEACLTLLQCALDRGALCGREPVTVVGVGQRQAADEIVESHGFRQKRVRYL